MKREIKDKFLSIRIEDGEKKRLEQLANKEDISLSKLIQRCIKEYKKDGVCLGGCYVWDSNDLMCVVLAISENGMVTVHTEDDQTHYIDEGNLREPSTPTEQNNLFYRTHLKDD